MAVLQGVPLGNKSGNTKHENRKYRDVNMLGLNRTDMPHCNYAEMDNTLFSGSVYEVLHCRNQYTGYEMNIFSNTDRYYPCRNAYSGVELSLYIRYVNYFVYYITDIEDKPVYVEDLIWEFAQEKFWEEVDGNKAIMKVYDGRQYKFARAKKDKILLSQIMSRKIHKLKVLVKGRKRRNRK